MLFLWFYYNVSAFSPFMFVISVMVELAGTGVALHAQMVISHDGAPLIMESEFVGRII